MRQTRTGTGLPFRKAYRDPDTSRKRQDVQTLSKPHRAYISIHPQRAMPRCRDAANVCPSPQAETQTLPPLSPETSCPARWSSGSLLSMHLFIDFLSPYTSAFIILLSIAHFHLHFFPLRIPFNPLIVIVIITTDNSIIIIFLAVIITLVARQCRASIQAIALVYDIYDIYDIYNISY